MVYIKIRMYIGLFRVWGRVCGGWVGSLNVSANRVVGNTPHVHIFARKLDLFHAERGFNARTCTFFRRGSGPFVSWEIELRISPAASWYTWGRSTHVEQVF